MRSLAAVAVVAVSLLACSRKPEGGQHTPNGSAQPPHITNASPTVTTMTVPDFLAQATAGGTSWSLRHVRVHGTLDAVTRDGSGCITAVTLHDGSASVQCTLVDPSPVPLHEAVTVDGQVAVDSTPPSLAHCRVMAPAGAPGPLEPACVAGSAAASAFGSATASPSGSAASKPSGSAAH